MPDTLKSARNGAAARIAAARGKLRETAEDVGERAAEAGDAGKAWAADRNDALRGLMRERPIASAGVSAVTAFVGGLILGILLERAFEQTEERQWQKRLRAAKSHLPNWRDY